MFTLTLVSFNCCSNSDLRFLLAEVYKLHFLFSLAPCTYQLCDFELSRRGTEKPNAQGSRVGLSTSINMLK